MLKQVLRQVPVLLLLQPCCVACSELNQSDAEEQYDEPKPFSWIRKHHYDDGERIWEEGVVSHLPDISSHYLVYACQVNHSCPHSRRCVVDPHFDFSFVQNSSCTCDAHKNPRQHVPGHIRQGRGCELCLHKALFPPNRYDWYGLTFLLLAGALSGAVGIGGGGLNVPILVIAMNFHVKEAVPLAHVGVFGSAFAQNLVNVPRRHPLTEARPLIDAEIALLLMPCMLSGHSLGVLLGPVFPDKLVEAVAVLILLVAAFKSTRSAYKLYAQEVAEGRRLPIHCCERGPLRRGHGTGIGDAVGGGGGGAFDASGERNIGSTLDGEDTPEAAPPYLRVPEEGEEEMAAGQRNDEDGKGNAGRGFDNDALGGDHGDGDAGHTLLNGNGNGHHAHRSGNGTSSHASNAAPGLAAWAPPPPPPRELPRPIDGGRVLLLLLTFMLFTAQYRLSTVHIPRRCNEWGDCNYRYLPYEGFRLALWLLILLIIASSVWLTGVAQRERDEYMVPELPGDIRWSPASALSAQCMAVLVGTIAGVLGLGGGELMAPLLVHLGMLPEVVSAVNAFMVFFTSAADLEHYSDIGVLQLYSDTVTRPGYVVLALVVGFTGAMLGRTAALRLIKHAAHPSLLVFLLGVALTLSALLLVGRLARREEQGVGSRSEDLLCHQA